MYQLTEIEIKRQLAIMNRALDYGFRYADNKPMDDIVRLAEEYLMDYAEGIEAEASFMHLGREQRAEYTDKNGWAWWSEGFILDLTWSNNGRIFFDTIIDSDANVISLYTTI